MNPVEVRWSRNHFDLLAVNAVWGIPRSGLVFQKVSQYELALFNVMPWNPAMRDNGLAVPHTPKALRDFQRRDFETISMRFTAAGIRVTDPKGLLKD